MPKSDRLLKNHLHSGGPTLYKFFRNLVNLKVKETKADKELKIARQAKTNPKAFYNYVNSKIKPKDTVSNFRTEDGSLTKMTKKRVTF